MTAETPKRPVQVYIFGDDLDGNPRYEDLVTLKEANRHAGYDYILIPAPDAHGNPSIPPAQLTAAYINGIIQENFGAKGTFKDRDYQATIMTHGEYAFDIKDGKEHFHHTHYIGMIGEGEAKRPNYISSYDMYKAILDNHGGHGQCVELLDGSCFSGGGLLPMNEAIATINTAHPSQLQKPIHYATSATLSRMAWSQNELENTKADINPGHSLLLNYQQHMLGNDLMVDWSDSTTEKIFYPDHVEANVSALTYEDHAKKMNDFFLQVRENPTHFQYADLPAEIKDILSEANFNEIKTVATQTTNVRHFEEILSGRSHLYGEALAVADAYYDNDPAHHGNRENALLTQEDINQGGAFTDKHGKSFFAGKVLASAETWGPKVSKEQMVAILKKYAAIQAESALYNAPEWSKALQDPAITVEIICTAAGQTQVALYQKQRWLPLLNAADQTKALEAAEYARMTANPFSYTQQLLQIRPKDEVVNLLLNEAADNPYGATTSDTWVAAFKDDPASVQRIYDAALAQTSPSQRASVEKTIALTLGKLKYPEISKIAQQLQQAGVTEALITQLETSLANGLQDDKLISIEIATIKKAVEDAGGKLSVTQNRDGIDILVSGTHHLIMPSQQSGHSR